MRTDTLVPSQNSEHVSVLIFLQYSTYLWYQRQYNTITTTSGMASVSVGVATGQLQLVEKNSPRVSVFEVDHQGWVIDNQTRLCRRYQRVFCMKGGRQTNWCVNRIQHLTVGSPTIWRIVCVYCHVPRHDNIYIFNWQVLQDCSCIFVKFSELQYKGCNVNSINSFFSWEYISPKNVFTVRCVDYLD